MILENWAVVMLQTAPYQAPEQAACALSGQVYGHPCFPPGEFVTTSPIVKVEDACVLTRSGSRYELGEPAADYEAAYPNAKQRLLTGEAE